MNPVIKNLTVDLDRQQMHSEIMAQCKQGDYNSYELVISLRENGIIREVQSSQTLRLRLLKPDGKAVYADLPKSTDGKVHITLEGQMLTAPGTAVGDVEIKEGDALLSTFLFYLDIGRRAVPDGTIESTDDFGALQDALDRAETVTKAADAAEKKREEAEKERAEAEKARAEEFEENEKVLTAIVAGLSTAESERNEAETARKSAESAREAAEKARQTAEQKRQTDSAEAVESANTAAARANAAAESVEGTDVGDLALRLGKAENKLTELGNSKVDKEEGKGLSANDFTNEYREKLKKAAEYEEYELELLNGATGEIRGYRIGSMCRIVGYVMNVPEGKAICNLPSGLEMTRSGATSAIFPIFIPHSQSGNLYGIYSDESGQPLMIKFYAVSGIATPVLPCYMDLSYLAP